MATTARRKITITYSGDVEGENELNATTNQAAPGMIDVVTLEAGNNTIDIPEGATAVTIVPPTDNEYTYRIRGADDEAEGEGGEGGPPVIGVKLSKTQPSSIALDSDLTAFVLRLDEIEIDVVDDEPVYATLAVRLFWS